MQFMAPVTVTCDTCQGHRFQDEVLSVRLRGRNIYETLELTVDEALEVFASGRDPYKVMAAEIYQVPYDTVNDHQRFIGKQATLGLGFQMSAKKFIIMCDTYGVVISM